MPGLNSNYRILRQITAKAKDLSPRANIIKGLTACRSGQGPGAFRKHNARISFANDLTGIISISFRRYSRAAEISGAVKVQNTTVKASYYTAEISVLCDPRI